MFSLVGHVVGLVPRWLVVAAGVVAVAFIGAEAYLKIRAQWAETREIEEKSRGGTMRLPSNWDAPMVSPLDEDRPKKEGPKP